MNMIEYINTYLSGLNTEGPKMPIETQAEFLSKSCELETATIKVPKYDSERQETSQVEEEHVLICLKDIVCNSRPKLYLGDYWLWVDIVDGSAEYRFFYKTVINDETHFQPAQHPHLSGGKPCLGTHAPDLVQHLIDGNYIGFISGMRNYLRTYTARDTYYVGTYFRKCKVKYQLHTYEDIVEIFKQDDKEDHTLDVKGIAEDKTRWNFPKDMVAWDTFMIEGQELRWFLNQLNTPDTRLPGLNAHYAHQCLKGSRSNYYYNANLQKIMGYIAIAKEIGELDTFHAYNFVKIFLFTLWSQYKGEYTPETMQTVRKMSADLAKSVSYRRWAVSDRHHIDLNEEDAREIEELKINLNEITGTSESHALFAKKLKSPGDKIGNFITLLHRMRPDLAKLSTYFDGTAASAVNIEKLEEVYNKRKAIVYKKALENLEKDKRRLTRELNKTNVVHTEEYEGQGRLFS